MDILHAAYTVRYHLKELLNNQDADTIKQKLDELLTKAQQGKDVISDIRKVLQSHKETRKWTNEFINYESARSFSVLPGESTTGVRMKKYICPEKNCKEYWFQQRTGQKIPDCPIHHLNLIQSD